MSAVGLALSRQLRSHFSGFKTIYKDIRCLSTPAATAQAPQESPPKDPQSPKTPEYVKPRSQEPVVPSQYRFVYPEFLPDPTPGFRNHLREKLERIDMMARRTVLDIPEFYVGSILAVTYSEPHAPGKSNKFVGICIDRKGCGLRAYFLLRNVIDHQGVEVKFDLYDPAIQKIDCLRLEKRLDEELYYLRDAPLEYSTFPVDMEMELLPEGSEVPINTLQVPLKPRPWLKRWEIYPMKGIVQSTIITTAKKWLRAEKLKKPWEKYDLMKEYRSTIPEEEQQAIYSEVYSKLNTLEISRKKLKRKRGFVRPAKGQ
ncbi:39S ribosomal protein L19, mitochondrial [Diachasma alloeum]|uniref:39S ribosomal protein L19, mitochondrial n=1 Tax=Diachasma alloeum TaxID=454923 RepID=UPI0007383E31|nr:39S ribosomal protein L19, mitochondrial [Diachasma alloeum]